MTGITISADTIEVGNMAARFVVKPFPWNESRFGIVDCAKDDWTEHWVKSGYGGESRRYAFEHQEAAQYQADKLNAEENEGGE